MDKENVDKKPQPVDYSAEERYDRKRAIVVALLKWLECEFFGAFVFLMLFSMSALMGKAGNFIFGTLGLVCYICILADFGMKEGARAHIKNTVRGDNVKGGFGLLLGTVSALPALASYIMLLLSYFGIIGSAVLPFKILNSGIWGYINLFVQNLQIENTPLSLLIFYPIMLLIFPITVGVTFKIGFDNIDLQTKIMYKKS